MLDIRGRTESFRARIISDEGSAVESAGRKLYGKCITVAKESCYSSGAEDNKDVHTGSSYTPAYAKVPFDRDNLP